MAHGRQELRLGAVAGVGGIEGGGEVHGRRLEAALGLLELTDRGAQALRLAGGDGGDALIDDRAGESGGENEERRQRDTESEPFRRHRLLRHGHQRARHEHHRRHTGEMQRADGDRQQLRRSKPAQQAVGAERQAQGRRREAHAEDE